MCFSVVIWELKNCKSVYYSYWVKIGTLLDPNLSDNHTSFGMKGYIQFKINAFLSKHEWEKQTNSDTPGPKYERSKLNSCFRTQGLKFSKKNSS